MSWCPDCGSEYREGFAVCAECGATLVEVRPAELSAAPEPEWVTAAAFTTDEEAELAQGYLEREGIPASILDKQMHVQPYGVGLLGEVLVQVPPHLVERARALLAQAPGEVAEGELEAEAEAAAAEGEGH